VKFKFLPINFTYCDSLYGYIIHLYSTNSYHACETTYNLPTSSNLFVPRWWMFILHVQWNLFTMDTLGPAISGSSLLLYRGFPLSEVKMY